MHAFLVDFQKWNVEFWDISAEERFNTYRNAFFYAADCCIVVFDVTRDNTYRNMYEVLLHVFLYDRTSWLSSLNSSWPDIPVIYAANKIDLNTEICDRDFEILKNVQWFCTSAKTSVNIVRLVNESIRLAVQNRLNPADKLRAEILRIIQE